MRNAQEAKRRCILQRLFFAFCVVAGYWLLIVRIPCTIQIFPVGTLNKQKGAEQQRNKSRMPHINTQEIFLMYQKSSSCPAKTAYTGAQKHQVFKLGRPAGKGVVMEPLFQFVQPHHKKATFFNPHCF